VAAAVLVGGVAAASGSGSDATQLRAWSIDAPSLPVPAGDPGAPTARTTADAESELDDGREVASAEPERTPDSEAPPAGDRLPSGAPSDAAVAEDLKRALGRKEGSARTLISAATVDGRGLASIPPDAPSKVVQIIQAANEVARKPYVYGGGHGRFAGSIWTDSAYDCSGSISYALAAAGLIDAPMVSGAMASDFKPGPGKWVTIYANGGHAFMFVAGLRFDTSGLRQTGSRWQSATRSVSGFREVHIPGL
jgi:cell wall-associated NlpC family hydrolase